MDKHIEIRVNIEPVWAELVADLLLSRCGCVGVVTEETDVQDDVVTRRDIQAVKAYLPEKSGFDLGEIRGILCQERKKLIESSVKEDCLGSWDIETKEILDDEWAHSWKKFWHPQKIGEKLVICPSWEDYKPDSDDILIELDPGSAFGTGSHPTTRLCAQALEKAVPADSNSLTMADVGTGSGILAIAGIKLGIDSVVGVDNDASVISVAEENAVKNCVEGKYRFYAGSATDISGKYDFVVANIITEVLVTIMADLESLMKDDGILILSGIIRRKLPEIERSLKENSLIVKEILKEEDWVAVIATKK